MNKRLVIMLLMSLFASLFAGPVSAQETDSSSTQWIHPFDYPQSKEYPEEIYAVIEIPQGSLIKYEIDADTGYVVADRFQSMSVQYPGNYGSIPQTIGGDGDPLDVIVLTREPLAPGTVIKVRPIGTLKMIDGGEPDDKVVAVPAAKIDPSYKNVKALSDLPEIEVERIEQFFAVYKQLPEGRKIVELDGFEQAEATKQAIKQAVNAYKANHSAQKYIPYLPPFHYPQDAQFPDEIMALIEIPAGSFTKYEIDADNGHLVADRFQSMPVKYPANYGSIPQTIGGDGDPLDVIVLTREPLAPKTFIKVRPIGTLKMIDGGEPDEKIVAVPVSDVDPTYDSIHDIGDLPEIEAQRIEKFFAVYKQLPAGRKSVELNGYTDAAATKTALKTAIEQYRKADNQTAFDWVHPFDYPQEGSGAAEFNAVIEIPAGSFTKYEIDADTGHLVADRFQSMAVHYPGNYGSIPQSKGGDGDPLDVLVLARQPLVPGTVVKVRAIGMLKMIDDGEADDKIVAVPVSDVDPTYDKVTDISELPAMQAEQIEMFFKVYKLLPSNRKYVEINGFDKAAAAQAEVAGALQRYQGMPVSSDAVIGGVEKTASDNRTLVPLRAIAELIGAEIGWDEAARSATVKYNGKAYTIALGNAVAADQNGAPIELDLMPQLMNGSMFVPLSFVAEQLEVKTRWNESAGQIEVLK
ncbi:inorganic diphosphatase [Paenibacillus ginsengihumi]|uniref:inorganic diphosphatase n=1 Tax=Paenibacillus ginsengihumi TaxID=431596 RepID=UPI00035CE54D|nr:inorganic diphosphatase [Paenibacillus ginsengihumi]